MGSEPAAGLRGRCCVVTGASGGVGAAIATALAGQGARVALLARSRARLQELAARLTASGATVLAVACDCSQPEQVEAARVEISRAWGEAAVLVNAAGTCGALATVAEGDPADWIGTLQTNLLGPYLMTRSWLPGMLRNGWGRIINLGSAASLHPPGALTSAYAVSKAALDRFTRQVACEILGSGVTINVIHPGEVQTEMWQAIHDQAAAAGPAAAGLRAWAALVAQTGGDPPEAAAALVLRIIGDARLQGRFLWIENGVQEPLPSWDPPEPGPPASDAAHPVLQHLRHLGHQQGQP